MTSPQVPYFNAPMYLENKSGIGKVDEILGPINQVYFTIKPSEGIQATSFKMGDKVYIAGDKLLPLERFLPKPKPPPGTKGGLGRAAQRAFPRNSRERSAAQKADTKPQCRCCHAHALQSRSAEGEAAREADEAHQEDAGVALHAEAVALPAEDG